MSQALSIAHARGWNLATTLMACIAIYQLVRSFRVHLDESGVGHPAVLLPLEDAG